MPASVPQGNRSARQKKGRRRALPRYTESAALCGRSQMTDQPSTGSGKKAVWGTVDKALQTDGRGGVAGRRRETGKGPRAGGHPQSSRNMRFQGDPYTPKVLGFCC